MLSYDPTLSHHLEACPEAPSLQMGQPADRLLQRQQTDNLPLGQLIAELNRYRPGHLGCDPAVAQLPVSFLTMLALT